MIKNIQIAGVHTKLTTDEEMYIDKKIGTLDRFIPKKSREAAKVDVKLKESKRKTARDKFTCEVIFHLDQLRLQRKRALSWLRSTKRKIS
jgi:ribosome-associated translation inhibitor RaiA